MMPDDVRILLLADSHLGFDLPVRPRVERRRRGHDFLANYAAVLEPALAGEVDLVVHAGDVFDRSKVVPTVAYQAFEPLRRVADGGVPVFIVPGNHERARLPHLRFASHPGVHVFDRPRTFVTDVRGTAIALAGFPYERHVRARFPDLVRETGWEATEASVRLLCLHHCVEGATVGPVNYTFTTADDVVRLSDVPRAFAAVLSGHIHRHQVLTADLTGRRLAGPVMYPGSIERTAFAEMGEPKGFMILHVRAGEAAPVVRWEFRELRARPMLRREIQATGLAPEALASTFHAIIAAAPADAVLAIRVTDGLSDAQWRAVSSARVRAMSPVTMNVQVEADGGTERQPRRSSHGSATARSPQLTLLAGDAPAER
jgi:DNA repair exonuclease SbcCD nuclease subunit